MKSLVGTSSGAVVDAAGHAGRGLLEPTDSCDEWFDRFHEYRLSLGYQASRYAWDAWISPFIGAKSWVEVTPADAERIRDSLDRAMTERRVRGAGLRRLLGRSASDIWRLLLACVRAAKRTKRLDLRALAGRPNPVEDIEPPGERATRLSRKKPFIYPSDAAELFAPPLRKCGESSTRSRRTCISVRVSSSCFDGRTSTYGTEWLASPARGTIFAERRRARRPSRVPAMLLRPLLERMRGAPEHRVVPLLGSAHRVTVPRIFRARLQLAGVVRSALHTSTMTTMRASFRSWRDSGLTWLALAGVGVGRIARRAGHEDLRMTLKYVKHAEDLTGQLGAPFGPLPSVLVDG